MSKHRLWAKAGLALAVVAIVGLLIAGPGYRLGLWHFSVSFKLMQYAAFAGIGAVLLSLAGLILDWRGNRSLLPAIAGLLLGAVASGLPTAKLLAVKKLPYIHDISTDTQAPPEFIAVLPLRADAPNPAVYEGAEIAAQQQAAYPDIQPLLLNQPPDEAFERALTVARESGWQIVAAEKSAGRIEATDTTFWFGFKDDVVIRITPAPTGSRIDVRSVSRVGKSDVGANAARIRRYLTALQNARM